MAKDKDEGGQMVLGLLLCSIGAFTMAVVVVATRALKNMHFSLILFSYSSFATVFYLSWIIIESIINKSVRLLTYPITPNWPLMLSAAVANNISLVLRTLAFQQEKSAVVSTLMYI